MQRKLKKTKMLDEYVAKESFDKLKEIVDEVKDMENLSINTLKNFNKVYTALYEYFGDEKNVFELNEFDARDFLKFLQNEKILYKDKIHKTGKQRGLRPTRLIRISNCVRRYIKS